MSASSVVQDCLTTTIITNLGKNSNTIRQQLLKNPKNYCKTGCFYDVFMIWFNHANKKRRADTPSNARSIRP
jgi:hypothetical protein